MRTVSSQCRNPLMGQQQQQARKALHDDACTGLSLVKIRRKNMGLLQSFCTYRCSVERQLIETAEQLCRSRADCREGGRLFSTQHSFHVQGKRALGMEGLQQPVPCPLLCIMGVPRLGDQPVSADCPTPLWVWQRDLCSKRKDWLGDCWSLSGVCVPYEHWAQTQSHTEAAHCKACLHCHDTLLLALPQGFPNTNEECSR